MRTSRLDWIQSLRVLRRSPGYALYVTAVVALGTALAATTFATVDGTLFKPLPYRDSHSLFAVRVRQPPTLTLFPGRPVPATPVAAVVSPADMQAWTAALPGAHVATFTIGAYQAIGPGVLVPRADVSDEFFDVLQVKPLLGGLSSSDFESRDRVRPAVISHAFWQTRLGGSPSVIGRPLLDETGAGIRVVGVLRSDFVFPDASSSPTPVVLLPLRRDSASSTMRYLHPIVRLSAGTSAEQASAALTSAALATRSGFDQVQLVPLATELTERFRATARAVTLGAGVLLVLACLNLAVLAGARARDRWPELRVRRALGAGLWQIVRLVHLENTMLVATGVLCGVVSARPLLELILALSPTTMPFLKTPQIDARVLVFTAAVFALCAALMTAWAAVVAGGAFREGVRQRRDRGRSAARVIRVPIVSAQVALALSATVAGTLMTASLLRVWAEDPGFNIDHTAVLRVGTGRSTTPAPEIEQLVAAVRSRPDVIAAGATDRTILQHAYNGSVFSPPPGIQDRRVESMAVTDGFLQAAGIPVVSGRLPTPEEWQSGQPVIVVSEAVARQYWPGEPAVGKTLVARQRTFTVVGIVGDARYLSLDQKDVRGVIYWPLAAKGQSGLGNILVAFAPGSRPALDQVVADLTRLCPTCRWTQDDTFGHTMMLSEALGWTIRQRRLHAWVFALFGVSALVIAATGICGVVAIMAGRRTKELGIRLALGATRRQVVVMLLREQMVSVAAGMVAGGTIAAWTVRLLQSQVYEMGVYDPWVWTVAVGVVATAALTAGAIPSLSATRLDPAHTLRAERRD